MCVCVCEGRRRGQRGGFGGAAPSLNGTRRKRKLRHTLPFWGCRAAHKPALAHLELVSCRHDGSGGEAVGQGGVRGKRRGRRLCE